MSTTRFVGLALVAALAVGACGDDDGTSPSEAPTSVSGVSGNNQTAVVGQTLTNPITVRVTDDSAEPVGGVDVVFAVTSGGGDVGAVTSVGLAGAEAASSALQVTVTTNALGEAAAAWTLGTTAGTQTATATVTGLTPFQFSATAEADAPDAIEVVSGDAQEGLLGEPLAAPFVVRVSDQFDNDVAGATVDWAVDAGNATLAAASSTTNEDGEASNTVTPQAAGPVEVSASLGSLTPVTFAALAKAETSDPAGDEFSTSSSSGLVPPDITRMTAYPEGTNLVVELEFVNDVVSDETGGDNVVVGFLDLDIDQNASTGSSTNTDAFRPGAGSTNMGMEYFINMFIGTNGEYEVVEVGVGTVGGFVPSFAGNVLTMTIPLSLIGGDDGLVNIATVVGTEPEPTDIAPNDGNLATGPPPAPVVTGTPAAGSDSPRRWGPSRR